jgi:hypothetical protein
MECILCFAPLAGDSAAPWAVARDGKEYFKCGVCDLVWLSPEQRPGPQAERSRYLEHRNEIEDTSYLEYLSRLGNSVCALISPGALGIDYGSGPAEGMRALLEPRGFRVVSYDPYFFPDADLSPGRYQFLLCNEAAEHFYRPAEEFARIDSIVDNGAVLGFSSGLVRSKEAFLGWTYRHDPTHVIFFSEPCVRWLGERFGWDVLSVEKPRFLFRKR